MAVGSPEVICREQGNMHRMWYCTESSTCFHGWAKVGWMGAVDHTTAKTGQDQADFPASSKNFRVVSVVSFTWAMVLLLAHESLCPQSLNSHFLFVLDHTHPSSCFILIIYCYSSAWWLRTEEAAISNQATNLYNEREGLCYFCLFSISQDSKCFGWHDMTGNRPFSDFQSYYDFIWLWITTLLVMQKVGKETENYHSQGQTINQLQTLE